MKLHFFDDEVRPDIIGPLQHGPLGFNHCGSSSVDSFYQAQVTLEYATLENSTVVRAELHASDGEVLRRWVLKRGRWEVEDAASISVV